jgi:hypothetical protein
LSRELIQSVLFEGSRYPLDMFWHIARTTPLTLFLAMTGLRAARRRLAASGGPRARAARLWIGWVLWFRRDRIRHHHELPVAAVAFMLMAIAVDLRLVLRRKRAGARSRIRPSRWQRSAPSSARSMAAMRARQPARPTIRRRGIASSRRLAAVRSRSSAPTSSAA